MSYLKVLIIYSIFTISCSYGIAFEDVDIDIYGETKYSKSNTTTLISTINTEWAYRVYEPSHKKWSMSVKGIVSPDLDHFQNEIKINTFTVLAFDF